MNTETAIAIEHHALAICAWALVVQTDDIAKQATRVTTARECSQTAIRKSPRLGLEITDPIYAACIDAKVEAAIQAHTDAITILA